jgi:hypothetical protein
MITDFVVAVVVTGLIIFGAWSMGAPDWASFIAGCLSLIITMVYTDLHSKLEEMNHHIK